LFYEVYAIQLSGLDVVSRFSKQSGALVALRETHKEECTISWRRNGIVNLPISAIDHKPVQNLGFPYNPEDRSSSGELG
jgi:hypothetical protein